MAIAKKMQEKIIEMQDRGWHDAEYWNCNKLCILTRFDKIQAVTSTGKLRELTRSEKEQIA